MSGPDKDACVPDIVWDTSIFGTHIVSLREIVSSEKVSHLCFGKKVPHLCFGRGSCWRECRHRSADGRARRSCSSRRSRRRRRAGWTRRGREGGEEEGGRRRREEERNCNPWLSFQCLGFSFTMPLAPPYPHSLSPKQDIQRKSKSLGKIVLNTDSAFGRRRLLLTDCCHQKLA